MKPDIYLAFDKCKKTIETAKWEHMPAVGNMIRNFGRLFKYDQQLFTELLRLKNNKMETFY